MYTVNIDPESMDKIIVEVLTQDYDSVMKELTELKSRENLPEYQNEDVKFLSTMLPAFETILTYYMVHSAAQKLISDTRKKYGMPEQYTPEDYLTGKVIASDLAS